MVSAPSLIQEVEHGLVGALLGRWALRAAFVAAVAFGAVSVSGAPLAPGESVPAESILRDMREGKDIDLRGRVIEGSLETDLLWPTGDERIVSTRVIAGKVNIESCRVTGRFAFPRCVFAQGLDLSRTEIRGDLDLSDTQVLGSLTASQARVLGEIRAPRLRVSGLLSFADGFVGGRIDLTSIRIDGSVDFSGARLSRDIEISKSIVGGIDLSSARVSGLTRLDDVLVLGEAAAHDASFGKGLQVDSLRTVGSLDLDGAGGPGEISLRECLFGRDLFLSLATRGPTGVSGAVVGRQLSLLDGQFSGLTIDRVRVGNGSELEGIRVTGPFFIRDSDFGETFSAAEAFFEDVAAFTKVRFPGEDPLAGAIFRSAPSLVDTVLPRPPTVESVKEEPEEEGDDDAGEASPD